MKKRIAFLSIFASFNSFGQFNASDFRIGLSYQPTFTLNLGSRKIQEFDDNTVKYQYDYMVGKVSANYAFATGLSMYLTTFNDAQISVDLLYSKRNQLFEQQLSEYEQSSFTALDTMYNIHLSQNQLELHVNYNFNIIETARTYTYFTGGFSAYTPILRTTTWIARPHNGEVIDNYHVYEDKNRSLNLGLTLGFSTEFELKNNLWVTIRPQYTNLISLRREYDFSPHQLRLHVGISYMI